MKSKWMMIAAFVPCLYINMLAAQDTSVVKTLPDVTVKARTKKIPPKVWFGLSRYFREAENPRWYALNKDYLVKFMTYTQEHRALLNKNGKVVYHISYGWEGAMPAEIDRRVVATYPGYEIYRSIKIREANREVWLINLQNDKELIMVRLENDELEEIHRMGNQ
jgi:hypothetical protein